MSAPAVRRQCMSPAVLAAIDAASTRIAAQAPALTESQIAALRPLTRRVMTRRKRPNRRGAA